LLRGLLADLAAVGAVMACAATVDPDSPCDKRTKPQSRHFSSCRLPESGRTHPYWNDAFGHRTRLHLEGTENQATRLRQTTGGRCRWYYGWSRSSCRDS